MSAEPLQAPDVEEGDAFEPKVVLASLRHSRRRRRIQDFDVFEAVYRVYIAAVVSMIVLWVLSGVVGGSRLSGHQVQQVVSSGPRYVGALVAAAALVALRSGIRGGPLAIEAADVAHVMMAPVDRALALRGPALRQVRFGAAVGAGVGALAGLLAYRRLPGGVIAWIACGGAAGALAVAACLGLAMIASGHRLGRWRGTLIALVIVGWTVADNLVGTVSSPFGLLGKLACWPLRFQLEGLIGAAVCAGLALLGVGGVGGTSIEAAGRRSLLVGQLRFAATMRDLRTVMVLRRQLAQDVPRQRPWIRLPRTITRAPAGQARPGKNFLGAGQGRLPSWRRSWHGILRFPLPRLLRFVLLGAGAGASCLGAWRGTTPLIAVAGICFYIAGLDAAEPVAQELDHPDRQDEYPVRSGDLLLRLAGPPICLMVLVAAVGLGVAFGISGGDTQVLTVGGVLLVPAALAGMAGALISVIQGPPPAFSATDSMLPPEAAGARAIARMIIPVAVAVIGVLPLLAARSPGHGVTPLQAEVRLVPLVVIMAILVGVWVQKRDAMHSWWKTAMEEARTQR